MYTGQVFALLGDNGAGKTTTINMLTGMITPDSGYATVLGKNILDEMSLVRNDLGICLQHDCLFPLLTVEEHIEFYARVKGLFERNSYSDAKSSILTAIENVGLKEKIGTLSKNLSGGMKRKLSVCIAFCGDSKVVFLDEPTSGMDPFSRRFTWNIIRHYRQNRIIILTTHFMDEADLLGDRIAILGAGGKLRCVGSSLFLKKEFGVGYRLTMEKQPRKVEETISLNKHEDSLKDTVFGNVAFAKLLTNVGTELSFQLPLDSRSQLARLFTLLDEKVCSKDIVTYGVSITTLEEVFLKISRGDIAKDAEGLEDYATSHNGIETSTDLSDFKVDEKGNDLFSRHLKFLFNKRVKNFKRDKKAWFCSVILPSLISLIGFLLVWLTTRNSVRNMSYLDLSLSQYNAEKATFQNPIPFNSPGSFICQPGVCLSDTFHNLTEETGELYYYCGAEVFLSFDYACSISASDDVMQQVTGNGAFIIPQNVSNPIEASMALPTNPSQLGFSSSQYGAIYFTHDTASVIVDQNINLSYEEAININYQARKSNYSIVSSDRYLGTGFLVGVNFTALHSALVYQAFADEALIRSALQDDGYTIKSAIHPLPITDFESKLGQSQDSFTAWFLMVLAFPFITGSFATFIVYERMSKAKHLQTVSGVKPLAYWLSSLLWDVLNYQIPCWIIVALMFIFGIDAFITSSRDAVWGTISIIFFFGPAAAAFTYCTCFLFDSPSTCNIFVIITGFFIGFVGALVVFILRLLGAFNDISGTGGTDYIGIARIIEWILRCHPAFNFSKALFFILNADFFASIAQNSDLSVWSVDVMLIEFIYLVGQSFLYFGLAIFLDRRSTKPGIFQSLSSFFSCLRGPSSRPSTDETELDDDDVIIEADRVMRGDTDDDNIVLQDIVKWYGTGVCAVNHVSMGIPPGECFGLLGVNGAGKTSIMGILTAEFPPSSGDVLLAKYSVKSSPEITRRLIGYCPQFDAHFQNMTGREHVELYAAIKGVPSRFIASAASRKLREVGISDDDSNKLSSTYSGGMKRKLSVACATIGDPKIVFLDEPSTGMDPAARRDMWRLISNMVIGKVNQAESDRTSVILTTHSMEECEALCARIAIMAGGKLRCLGSAQHLKSKFGKGWQVEVKVREVSELDDDYERSLSALVQTSVSANDGDVEVGARDGDLFFNLDQVISAVQALTGDESLSSSINPDDPNGYIIWRDAKSDIGVAVTELALYCAQELRVHQVTHFLQSNYHDSKVRERNYNRIRFEVPSDGLSIAALFRSMEDHVTELKLEDYSVSQTSLEQVFNVHAAEDERKKKEKQAM